MYQSHPRLPGFQYICLAWAGGNSRPVICACIGLRWDQYMQMLARRQLLHVWNLGKYMFLNIAKLVCKHTFFDFKPISCKSLSLSLSVYCCQCPSVKNKGAFARMPALSKILMTISFPWSWCWMLIWKHWLEVLKYFELISWIHPNSVSIWAKMMDWNIFVYSLGFDAGGVWVKFVRYNSLVWWAPWMFGKQLGGSQRQRGMSLKLWYFEETKTCEHLILKLKWFESVFTSSCLVFIRFIWLYWIGSLVYCL